MSSILQRQEEETSAYDLLDDRRRLFVDLYVGEAHCVASRAARMMGYSEQGSDRTIGWRMLADCDVKAAIQERLAAGVQMQADEVMLRLAAVARCDPRQFYREVHSEGCPAPGEECSCDPTYVLDRRLEADWSVVQRITRDRAGNETLELPSKVEALALIARRHALLTDRQVQSTQEVYDVEWTTPAVAQEGTILESSDTQPSTAELIDTPALPVGEGGDASE